MADEDDMRELDAQSSDSSDSDSDGGSDASEPVETLIAGRARRATAGNRMEKLLEQEEDDEVALLFAEAEDEEDVEFEGAGVDDDDVEMESSSDDEDQGPNAAVDEDLEGEKELQRQAKAERAKKRKAQEALTNLPAIRKKVKIDPNARSTSTAPAPRPKKKSERISWLPEAADAPVRASSRKQTMANKEVTHARLKDHEVKRRKLLEQMRRAERDREKTKPKQLTQADRLAEAARVEKKNAKSLNRWETMEKRRAEEQAAKLAALQNRKLEGPVFTWWSGKATWIGDKLVMVGSREVKLQPRDYGGEKRGRKKKMTNLDLSIAGPVNEAESTKTMADTPAVEVATLDDSSTAPPPTVAATPLVTDKSASLKQEIDPLSTEAAKDGNSNAAGNAIENPLGNETQLDIAPVEPAKSPQESVADDRPQEGGNQLPAPVESSRPGPDSSTGPSGADMFLQGIHEYASLDANASPATAPAESGFGPLGEAKASPNLAPATSDSSVNPSAAASTSDMAPLGSTKDTPVLDHDPAASALGPATAPERPPSMGPQSLIDELPFLNDAPTSTSAPAPPPPPQYSTRNLLVLTDFTSVTPATFAALPLLTKIQKEKPIPSTSNAITSITTATNTSGPKLTRAQRQALSTAVELCAVTSKPARFRDPETGIPYADSYAYKRIQEAKKSSTFIWSTMLGCYVGRAGEVAKGVPRGFLKDEGTPPSSSSSSSNQTLEKEKTNKSTNTGGPGPRPAAGGADGNDAPGQPIGQRSHSTPSQIPTPAANATPTVTAPQPPPPPPPPPSTAPAPAPAAVSANP